MSTEHERLRKLVLVWEDLEGDELAETTAHLLDCESCGRLRERVLAAEAVPRSIAALPAAPEPLAAFHSAERAQAKASLKALLGESRGGSQGRPRWLLPLALAAVIVFAAVLPAQRPRTPVRDLQVGSPLVLRGDQETPAATEHGVSFRLARPGYAVLIHVDGAGAARLVYPAPGEDPVRIGTDQRVLLPPARTGEAWRAGLAPGCETYLLAIAADDAPPDGATLGSLAFSPPRSTRDDAIGAVRRQLADLFGPVVVRSAPDCD